ncbi:MAG: AraC family transcriptional regulator, partial [Clostridia bacterium]
LIIRAVAEQQPALITQLIQRRAQATPASQLPSFCNAMTTLYSNLHTLLSLEPTIIPPLPADAAGYAAFFTRLFVNLSNANHNSPQSKFSPGVQQAIDYLRQHYAQTVRLPELAQLCDLSANHLSTIFKKETGQNLIVYLNRLRIYHAAYELLLGDQPLTAVCGAAGFGGYNHFFNTFRAVTGFSPTDFKKNPASLQWLLQEGAALLS